MSSTNKRVAIIIIGFNSSGYLTDLLQSINNSTYQEIEIIYVDNNSTDNSIKLVKQIYPKALVIQNKFNLGFAKANNQAIKIALQKSFEYIFLLNHDTLVQKNCIYELVKNANEHTILQPLILLHSNNTKTNYINTVGAYLNYLGFSYCDQYQQKYSKKIKLKRNILGASGAAMFIPVKVIKKIGFLDENYFMYFEDLDYCWRARIAGFHIHLVRQAIVWHKYKFYSSANKWLYSETSRLYFFLKNFQISTILKILPVYIISEILSIFYSIYGKFFIQKLHSYYKIIKILPLISNQRKSLEKIRTTNDSSLRPYIKSQLSYNGVRIPFLAIYNTIIDFYYKNIYLRS